MFRRTEGATIVQIIQATNWASDTVRGFPAGLKRKGIKVETLERIRKIGTAKDGANCSFSIHHAAG